MKYSTYLFIIIIIFTCCNDSASHKVKRGGLIIISKDTNYYEFYWDNFNNFFMLDGELGECFKLNEDSLSMFILKSALKYGYKSKDQEFVRRISTVIDLDTIIEAKKIYYSDATYSDQTDSVFNAFSLEALMRAITWREDISNNRTKQKHKHVEFYDILSD